MISKRIEALARECAFRGCHFPKVHLLQDYHYAALNLYAHLPKWEKRARSMAYAINKQDILVYEGDRLGARALQEWGAMPEKTDPDLDYLTKAEEMILQKYPEVQELRRHQLITSSSFGHIAWRYDWLLEKGVTGMREIYEKALKEAPDQKAEEFYRGVLIMLDALQKFSDRHIPAYRALGNHELADLMERVPRYPARNFREAVQFFWIQLQVVKSENPFGGNSPGWLDHYLWPYLERDLKQGIYTLNEAKELIDELFLRMDERLYLKDSHGETIVVGGTLPNGESAVNPLTYIMVQSMIDLNITHPLLYIRVPENPSEELMKLCTDYILSGSNRAQIYNDKVMMDALVKKGVPRAEAARYSAGGCMEIGIQGAQSDQLFCGYQNIPKMLELMITGGVCLKTGMPVQSFHARKSLAGYENFENFYADFLREATRITHISLGQQDIYSEVSAEKRPVYLISGMINDCLEKGRNMNDGGARYHDYGMCPLGLPNVADGLTAIKLAVFDQKICTAQEMIDALKVDFKGYERLQRQLQKLPKYGQDHPEADEMARRVTGDFADIYLSFTTRFGGKGLPITLSFQWTPKAAAILGATADGGHAGRFPAQGLTPHSSAMTEGITAAIRSACIVPYEKFPGGATTMWDFDSSWAKPQLIEALLKTFLDEGGQIFQGNTTPLSDLLAARERPEDYGHLIVRVGGYSARFTRLSEGLQMEIIQRLRHSA